MKDFDSSRLSRLMCDLTDFGKAAYPDMDDWYAATLPDVLERVIAERKAALGIEARATIERLKADAAEAEELCGLDELEEHAEKLRANEEMQSALLKGGHFSPTEHGGDVWVPKVRAYVSAEIAAKIAAEKGGES